MIHKTIFWVTLFVVLIAAAVSVYLLGGRTEMRTVAAIYIDGELYDEIDLSAVVTPYEFTVETDWGYNIVRVSHGAIEVVEADCAGQDCVQQGSISDGLIPIVCLPHKLVIQIEDAA